MKYNENNKPIQCFMTQSTCYKGTKKMSVKGVLWHSTGANNPNLKRYVQPDDKVANRAQLLSILGENKNKNDWNHIERKAGMNCWIGRTADGSVTTVQTMPWDYKPWGCGNGSKGSLNNGWIQFEICEDGLKDADYFNSVYREAVEITAYLCRLYNLNPNGKVSYKGVNVPVITCHADSYKMGLGNNHGDVLHWFKIHGKTMDNVRADVAALLEEKESPAAAAYKPTVKEWQLAAIADGFSFPEYGADGLWGRECESVAKKAIVKKRLVHKYTNLTKIIQRFLGVEVDGKCGKNTDAAIRAYQQREGLEADGACGLMTWRRILT